MTTYKLPNLEKSMVVVYPTGRVTPGFQRFWQNLSFKAQEGSLAASELPGVKADVSSNATAIATTSGALASLTTTVTANHNSLQAQVTSTQSAVSGLNGVYGKYGVNITAGDQFAGFELMAGSGAGGTVSYFKVASAKFIIDAPGGSVQPFVYDAIAGRLTVQNVRVRGDLIVDGTVFTNAIAPLAVTGPKVQRDEITQGRAVQAAPATALNSSGMTTILTYDHPMKGPRARLAWQFEVLNSDPTVEGNIRIEAVVNGVVVRPYVAILHANSAEHRGFSANGYATPGSTMHIRLQGQTDPGSSTAVSVNFVWLDIDDFGTEA